MKRTLKVALLLNALLWSVPAQNPPGFNYEEAKVGQYTLPDPLVMSNGSKVSNAQQWRKRRAEILRLFETNVYGRTPAKHPAIRFSETSRDENALGGLAVRREIAIQLLGKAGGPTMSLLLYVPKKKTAPAPVFLGMNFDGNHAVTAETGIVINKGWMRDGPGRGVIANHATESARGVEASRW